MPVLPAALLLRGWCRQSVHPAIASTCHEPSRTYVSSKGTAHTCAACSSTSSTPANSAEDAMVLHQSVFHGPGQGSHRRVCSFIRQTSATFYTCGGLSFTEAGVQYGIPTVSLLCSTQSLEVERLAALASQTYLETCKRHVDTLKPCLLVLVENGHSLQQVAESELCHMTIFQCICTFQRLDYDLEACFGGHGLSDDACHDA